MPCAAAGCLVQAWSAEHEPHGTSDPARGDAGDSREAGGIAGGICCAGGIRRRHLAGGIYAGGRTVLEEITRVLVDMILEPRKESAS